MGGEYGFLKHLWGNGKMNTVTVSLNDESLADLHAVQLVLREKWRTSPGLESHEVTQAEAIRHALVVATSGDWRIDDLMPDSTGSKQ